MNTTQIIVGAGGLAGGALIVKAILSPPVPAECIENETWCEGDDRYTCINGLPVLTGPGDCASPVCTNGQTECRGDDRWTCINSQWVLTGPGDCYVPPVITGDITGMDAPLNAEVGIPITVTVYGKNTSSVNIIGAIKLTVNGSTFTSPDVIMVPGVTYDEAFTVTFTSDGIYTVSAQLLGEQSG